MRIDGSVLLPPLCALIDSEEEFSVESSIDWLNRETSPSAEISEMRGPEENVCDQSNSACSRANSATLPAGPCTSGAITRASYRSIDPSKLIVTLSAFPALATVGGIARVDTGGNRPSGNNNNYWNKYDNKPRPGNNNGYNKARQTSSPITQAKPNRSDLNDLSKRQPRPMPADVQRPASNATASNWNASPVHCASTPATMSWTRLASPRA